MTKTDGDDNKRKKPKFIFSSHFILPQLIFCLSCAIHLHQPFQKNIIRKRVFTHSLSLSIAFGVLFIVAIIVVDLPLLRRHRNKAEDLQFIFIIIFNHFYAIQSQNCHWNSESQCQHSSNYSIDEFFSLVYSLTVSILSHFCICCVEFGNNLRKFAWIAHISTTTWHYF